MAEGIVEKAPSEANGKEFYVSHKPVVRESGESTKVRTVYDASARAYGEAPSLNECLENGPPLQNLTLGYFGEKSIQFNHFGWRSEASLFKSENQ